MIFTYRLRIKSFWAACTILLASLIFTNSIHATEDVVEVKSVSIISENSPEAQKTALNNAIEAAILETAVDIVGKDNLQQENFEHLVKLIVADRDKFVLNYKQVATAKTGTKLTLLIYTTLSSSMLKTAIKNSGLLRGSVQRDGILFLLTEQMGEAETVKNWWDPSIPMEELVATQTVATILKEKGFKIVGPIPDNLRQSMLSDLDARSDQLKAAIQLAMKNQMKWVVVGTAQTKSAPNQLGSEMQTYEAIVALSLFDVSSGQRIHAFEKNQLIAGADEAESQKEVLNTACRLAADELISVLSRQASRNTPSRLILKGKQVLTCFPSIRSAIMEQAGVSDVKMVEMQVNQIEAEIIYDGSLEDIAARLLQHTFDHFGIQIDELTTDSIVVEIVDITE